MKKKGEKQTRYTSRCSLGGQRRCRGQAVFLQKERAKEFPKKGFSRLPKTGKIQVWLAYVYFVNSKKS